MNAEIVSIVDEGFTPVPLFYGTKLPSVKWSGLNGSVPNAYISMIFDGLRKNVGILIRPPLAVLDFDCSYSYASWVERNAGLVATRTVATRRGFHVYLHVESGTYPARSKECDLKTNGIVLVPPSKYKSHEYYYIRKEPILTVPDMTGLGVEFRVPTQDGTGSVEDIAILAGRVDLFSELLDYSKARYPRGRPRRVNGHYLCHCPFHTDRNPSLGVWEDHFYCYSPNCIANKRCDGVDFIMFREDCGIAEAMLYIEENYNVR